MYLFILLTILFSFLRSTVLSWDLVTPLAIWLVLIWPPPRAWIGIWVSGLLTDIITGQTLGLTSLIYLTLALFLWWYQRKYYTFHPVFLLLFVSISLLVTNWLTTGQFNWLPALIWGIIFALFRQLIYDTRSRGRITI